jgi:autotransporter-associated beta strand protein
VNSVNNVILRNNGSGLLTLQAAQSGTMGVLLGNTTENIINIDSTGGATISSIISGSGRNLTIGGTGTGTLTLSGANTFSGAFVANATTTNLNVNNALSSVTSVTVASGATVQTPGNGTTDAINNAASVTLNGTLDLRGGSETVASLAGTNTGASLKIGMFNSTAGSFTFGDSNSTSFAGVISGSPLSAGNIILTKLGAGTVALSGANTYSGKTAISNGALSVASVNKVTSGSASSNLGAPTTTADGTIDFGGTTNSGQLTYAGTGETTDRVINLAGTTGGSTIDQSGTGLLKFTSNLTATGAGSKTLTLQGSTAGTGEISGAIVDNSGTNKTSVTKTGSGTWTLSGSNTYTGITTIGNGVCSVATIGNGGVASGNLGSATNAAANLVFDGGTLQYTGATASTDRNFTINAGKTATFDISTNTLTASGASASTNGALTKTGNGTLVLTGANAHTGLTSVSAGTLQLNRSGGTTLPTGNSVSITGTGTLKISSDQSISGLTMTAGTLTIDSGVTLTITGTYSVSGGTINNQGTIKLNGGDASFPGSGVTVNNGTANTLSNLEIASSGTVSLTASIIVGGTLTLTSGTFAIGANTLTLNNPIAGTATNLSAGSTSSITIAGSASGINIPSSVSALSNLTLNNSNGSALQASLTLNGTLTLTSGTLTNSNSLSLASGAGIARGSGSLSGTPTFSGNNDVTYTAALTTGSELPTSTTALRNLTINPSSATVTLNADATVNGTLGLSSGTFAIGSKTLTLNSSSTVTSGSFTSATSGTVVYNQSSNGQSVLALNYGNLTFSDFNKTLPTTGTVGIASTFTPGSGTCTVTGSTVDFNGTSAQTGPSVAFIYNNLTVSNSAGLTLAASQTVNGVLTLTGDITTGSNTLFQGGTSSGTGDVIGDVNRTDVSTGTTRSFGNPNVQITQDLLSTGQSITVNLLKASPTDFGNSVRRTYTITKNGGTLVSATVRLHYLTSELNNNLEGSLTLWRKGTSWTNQGSTSQSTSSPNNYVELTNVVGFSPWTLAANAPTDVALMNFNALSDDGGNVLLEWQTGMEVNNLGFNVYREQGGRREKINPTLLAGSVPLAGHTVMTAGLAYAWADRLANSKDDAAYWLEDVDLDGKTTLHGPISAVPVGKLPARADSLLLSQLHTGAANADTQRIVRPGSAADSQTPGRLSSGDLQKQWEIAAKAGAKIITNKAGWYRITQPQLVAAGFDLTKDAHFLQLFTDAHEVPLVINGGKNGRLEPADSIEFYAQALDTPSTNQRTYYLINGTQAGRRVPVLPLVKGSETRRRTFTSTVERRDRFLYFPSINNGEAENWFGAIVSPTPFNQAISLNKIYQDAADDAVLEVALQGLGSATSPPHTVRLLLNGQDLGAISFTGSQHTVAQFRLNQRLLQEGSNTLTLTSQANSDFSLIDWVRLSYAHRFAADQNSLLFTAAGGEMVQVTGFTTAGVRVFDLTDEQNPVELKALVEMEGKTYRATVAPQEAGERVLLALSDKGYGQGAQVVAQQPSAWHEAGQGADVVMITHGSLRPALEPLVGLRKQQGYQVAVVDIEDLYDEYSFGQHTPQAIQEFVAGTRNWKVVPRWVLLVGDASSDGKNYLGLGENDLVPTRLVWTNTFETATDDWLGDVNGDGLADVALGRLPVRTLLQAQMVINKIVSYDANQTSGALLVADRNDGFDFEAATTNIRSLLPAEMSKQLVFRSQMDDTAANRAIIDGINRGPKLVNYAGHGSASVWRGSLLTNDSVPLLTNQQALPVVISMTCLNNLFNDPRSNSLGESLLLWERGGAVAVWASSAQTGPNGQALMNQEFIRQLFQAASIKSQSLTLGEAITRAKTAAGDTDVRKSWILLGDPLMRIR